MRRHVGSILVFASLFMAGICSFSSTLHANDSEFTRVRRIYIEGARFMQEKRYQDAIPMLGQAYRLLSRSVKKGSQNKRVLRAHHKLRYFLGVCHYQVGSQKHKGTALRQKAIKRKHFETSVPLLQAFLQKSKSDTRRRKSAKMLAVMTLWLQKNPKPKERPKVIKKIIIKKVTAPKSRPLHPVPFIVMGVGIATALGGLATALVAMNHVSERDNVYKTLDESGSKEPFAGKVSQLHRQAETFATTSYVLWAVGGGITAVGAVLLFVMRPAQSKIPPTPRKTKTKNQLLPHQTLQLWEGR